MTFTSFTFLFLFLPIFILIALFASIPVQNICLLVLSLFFYAWGDPFHVIYLIVVILYNYIVVHSMHKYTRYRKLWLVQGIIINVFFLFYYKYYGFLLDSVGSLLHISIRYETIMMPLGISFLSFSVISSLVDFYHSLDRECPSLFDYALYVSFFPKLIMGPIERYRDFSRRIHIRFTGMSEIRQGLQRFIIGLAKKVLIADQLAMLFQALHTASDLDALSAWLMVLAFTFQIYFDFSGYSDMAIGLARMMGFSLSENFNYPYTATSITDFWRRWHMTLSSWFRDYIYIPLGGNRVMHIMHTRNIFIVWFCTGLWHGANWTFILWGLYFGVLLILEKYIFRNRIKVKSIRWLITFLLVMCSWVFFFSNSITSAFGCFMQMFGVNGFYQEQFIWYLHEYGFVLFIAMIAIFPLAGRIWIHFIKTNRIFGEVMLIVILVCCIAVLLDSSYHSFLYTAF